MELNQDSTNVFLPENLRFLRKEMNYSQEELAEQIGLNRGNIASYESGTAEPRICNLVKLARLFKVSVFDIIHGNLRDGNSLSKNIQPLPNEPSLLQLLSFDQYMKDAEDMENAIKGLQCIMRLKTNGSSEVSPDAQFCKEQFEQLYGVATHLLKSHLELLSFIKTKCKD